MPNYSVEPCWEIDGTARVGLGITRNGAAVTLGCPWDQRYTVANDLLANRRTFPGLTGTGSPRVNDVQIEGWGVTGTIVVGSEQMIEYEQARLEVTYEPLQADIPADPGLAGYDLIIETIEVEVNTKRYNSRKTLKWETLVDGNSYNVASGDAPSKQVRSVRLEREFIGLAVLPANIFTLVDSCNIAVYNSTILGVPFEAESLKYNGPVLNRTIRSDGSSGFNVKLSWSYKPNGWNVFWRPFISDYDKMLQKKTGDPQYIQHTPADMSSILF